MATTGATASKQVKTDLKTRFHVGEHAGVGGRGQVRGQGFWVLRVGRWVAASAVVFLPMVEALLETGDIRPNWKFEISRLTDISGALAGVVRKGGAPHLVHGSEFPLRDIREVAWAARRM